MKSKNKIEFLNQIRNDYLYIKKVLESCKTSEQVKITESWYNKVIKEKWEFRLIQIGDPDRYILWSSYIKEWRKLNHEISVIENSLRKLSIKKYEELL